MSNETFQIKEGKLSYLRYNDWTKEIILFFHGFTGSKNYFPEVSTWDKCILSFDRPGIGESSIVEYYTMEYFLTNVYEMLKSHGVSSVNLIGHSAGGYYAQLFACMYSELTSSLSLVSSMIPLNCPNTKDIVTFQWKFISLLSLHMKRLSQFYFKKMAEGIVKEYDKQFTQNLKTLPKLEKEYMENNYDFIKNAVIQAVTNDGVGVYYDAYALCQKRDELKISHNIPIYVWHGTKDDIVPIEFTKYFEANYKIKSIHKIEEAGHMLYLPYWDKIIEEIMQNDQ
jgi:pimeloyl-ACP methyl ester carboxylesterase